ncbi:uncharacterized protein LOC124538087 [Vanessa cardui]|uniref:uncharacterized protein LOC124538087 n=1 Tax=Vanessa cardui TaxID=171605 RepID=UPI001F1396A0|nr:uncharacterized protein LOC124538087 [Vanessa cardui]
MSDRKRERHSREKGRSRHGRHREKSSSNVRRQMDLILERLNVLEGNNVHPSPTSEAVTPQVLSDLHSTQTPRMTKDVERADAGSSSRTQSVSAITDAETTTTERIVDAFRSINTLVNHSFYISNFDPSVHDIDVWCGEVDRAIAINKWNDNECLPRIGNCLKGDARLWLNEWVTTDRSWSNFKREFKPLCPKKPDVANILFDVMNTDSNNYLTYADYARRSLLRLRVVRGLSDELISAIIIRGIRDPQIRAAATNAKLMPNDLVEFFSIYVKPDFSKRNVVASGSHNRNDFAKINNDNTNNRKRQFVDGRCFSCGHAGHRQAFCKKKVKVGHSGQLGQPFNVNSSNSRSFTITAKSEPCSFCKKSGHRVDTCFAKLKSETRNRDNVNFCKEKRNARDSDVVVAVICGVPVDILIDSGSTISLISLSLLKHFDCVRKPCFRVLRGIGGQEIETTQYVTLPIEFDEIALEVELFVVPSELMNSPVIIGTDVLNREGVTYVRTCDRQYLKHVSNEVTDVFTIESDRHMPLKTELTGENLQQLHEMVCKFSGYFITGTATSTVKTGTMSIKLKSQEPVNYRPYRLSQAEVLRVRVIVRDLLDKGIIRESESDYASPILLVTKKDGTHRMCVDFRKLNELTVRERFPLPLIDDHIDRLGHHKYFTSLDMATGFHQIPMEEQSIRFTGSRKIGRKSHNQQMRRLWRYSKDLLTDNLTILDM